MRGISFLDAKSTIPRIIEAIEQHTKIKPNIAIKRSLSTGKNPIFVAINIISGTAMRMPLVKLAVEFCLPVPLSLNYL